MTEAAAKCFLRCSRGLHPDILLAHHTRTVIGRGPDTKIKDKRCSREQIALRADYKKHVVELTQLGSNLGRFNGKDLRKDQFVVLQHGDKFEILSEEYEHKICFDPAPKKKAEPDEEEEDLVEKDAKTAKRKIGPTRSSEAKQQRLNFTKSEIQIKRLDRSADKVTWEECAEGQLYIMTYGDCQPSGKVKFDILKQF